MQEALHFLHGHLVEESQLSDTGGVEVPGGPDVVTRGKGASGATVKIGSVIEKADGHSLGPSGGELGHGTVEGSRGPAHNRALRRIELDTAQCSAKKAKEDRGFHAYRPGAPSRQISPEKLAPSVGSIGRREAWSEGECAPTRGACPRLRGRTASLRARGHGRPSRRRSDRITAWAGTSRFRTA